MSVDFPNRNNWLKVRATPRKLPGRFVHISARIGNVKLPNGTIQPIVVRPGDTFNAGRNAEKRAAKNSAKARVRMQSDRRMRQRQQEGYTSVRQQMRAA